MQTFELSPTALISSVWRHRSLLASLVQREVLGRYRGSVLGLAWSFFTPLLMLSVYTFVFGVIFKARWGSGAESRTEFALVLFVGMMVFNLFAECLSRAPSLVLVNPNYVKRVVFPLEVLPWVAVAAALFHLGVSLLVWLVAHLLLLGTPPATALLLPAVMLPLLLFTLGASWLLASLGVYLRDVGQFINILITVLMFLAPVFYPATAVPESLRGWLYANPLTLPIEMARDVLYWGRLPNGGLWLASLAAGGLVAWAGFAWFQKTRKGFADVL
jgi:lipopolysaccharide transport system permease protein